MTPPPKKRRRRWPLAIAAMLVGTTLAVAGVEILLRTLDPIGLNYAGEFHRYVTQAVEYSWQGKALADVDLDGHLLRMKPGIELDLGSFRVRSNRFGLRGPEVAEPKPADTFRVLLLGDSVAFGWGVDEEVTFARRLETEWNAAAKRPRLEVVDTGHPLYDTVQQAATLREFLPRLQPDLVLLVYVTNDLEPSRDTVEALLGGPPPDPAEIPVLPHDFWSWTGETLQSVTPALGQLLAAQTNIERRVQRGLGGRTYAPETFGKGPRGWARSQKALREIRDSCAAVKVPFLLLDHTRPAITSLPTFCGAEGIAIAPFAFSDADLANGICISLLDSHANAKGHDLLLQRLRTLLLERGLLPR
ncbi:MAG: SGNH/GDSL hydrolase family protein [Planctomycetes bacterium]|nr:SGNH/GDSL hydrolase family protein [Planctomycetota bacterium]